MKFAIPKDLARHAREFHDALCNNEAEQTSSGVLFPRQSALVQGMYIHSVNGGDERFDHNLVTTQGLNYQLAAALYGTAAESAWYLALYGGNVTPQATWTAANFTANSTEITSNSNGYSETTRRAWTPAAPASGAITNAASKASFTIAAPSMLNVYGAGLISSPVKGGTAGVLLSAGKFASVRALEDGDLFNLGYALTLTST